MTSIRATPTPINTFFHVFMMMTQSRRRPTALNFAVRLVSRLAALNLLLRPTYTPEASGSIGENRPVVVHSVLRSSKWESSRRQTGLTHRRSGGHGVETLGEIHYI